MSDESKRTASATIDFWLDFGSNYSYLSAMRIANLAAKRGVTVNWRPFMLGPIFQSLGWATSPFVLQKEKGAYVWRDMERQCVKYDLPWKRPTVFPRPATLPMKVAAAHSDENWIAGFCRSMMHRNFALDQEINSDETVRDVLTELELDPEVVLEQARSEPRKNRLREATEEARSLGIFGGPTFMVGKEMFWGNDRLDDALVLAAGRA